MPRAKVIAPKSYTNFNPFPHRNAAFVRAYLNNGRNAKKAAIEAGFPSSTATKHASSILNRPEVYEAIKAADEEAASIAGLSIARTLREVARIAYHDPGDVIGEDGNIKNFLDMPPSSRAAVASIEVDSWNDPDNGGRVVVTRKVKFWDKNTALEKAMKHHGLYEKDNKQLEGNVVGRLERVIIQASLEDMRNEPIVYADNPDEEFIETNYQETQPQDSNQSPSNGNGSVNSTRSNDWPDT